jgi:outer membrane receptor protein involved in Fe transport
LKTEITEFASNRVNDVANTIGDPLPGSPDWSGNFALSYQNTSLSIGDINAELSYSYHGEESNRLNAGAGNTSDEYSLINARLELAMLNGITLYAYGRNIGDEVYFLELNSGARLVGSPATYGAGFRYGF